MKRGRTIIASVAFAALAAGQQTVVLAGAATGGQPSPTSGATIAPIPKSCETPEAHVGEGTPLRRVAAALKERKKIRILAIGAGSTNQRGAASGGYYAVIERFLETSFKGVDVEIIDRGVSGELAADAAERIKTEVALAEADLLLWQVGTADAMAHVAKDDFQATVAQTVGWLKTHGIDVILIGVRYVPQVVNDPHYQAIRAALTEIATEQNVLRIGRYEAEETLARLRREQGVDLSEAEVTESAYACTAEYLARAIAAGLFARQSPPKVPQKDR